ncbi:MAG: CCA tRNA nucleotidyltransferase [Candidatus Latescibacterota bacterium]|nr:MAG: CCA tRNA nucleotidyltransferase [Candidatus Latescibacterota bacterium]RKY74291.1 MAG: CCA tRNA nucleotidyltransferase [Candidatus Latescibacterota bacterium]
MSEEIARRIAKRLREAGYEAYFVGGCVRDRILGVEPAEEDYDIATNAPPQEVMRIFPHTKPVGAQFGVVLVIEGGKAFEVATYRSERGYSDGRHPDEVSFSDLKEDALRRDFTINALYEDPLTGEILDPVGGMRDLKEGVLRAIGDPCERFKEDKLRMLRAIRFSSWLGFTIEPRTWDAIRALAHEVTTVSPERISEELRKLLTRRGRGRGVRLLHESGIMGHILPEVEAMAGVPQPPEFHPEGDVLEHTALTLENLHGAWPLDDPPPDPSWELALGALLHDVGKPPTFSIADRIRFNRHEAVGAQMAEGICRRLRTSNAVRERVVWLVKNHMVLKDIENMRKSTKVRLFSHPGFPELLELHRADALASHGKLQEYETALSEYKDFLSQPPPLKRLVTGHDLISMGLEPGPIFSELLSKVEDAQLEGKVRTREEALKLVRSLLEEDAVREG